MLRVLRRLSPRFWFLALSLASAGVTLWIINEIKWGYWSYGYARARCDWEGVGCDGMDEWGRPRK